MSMILETFGLTKRFGATLAVDSVSMRIEQGEIYGFIGKNGAGKTTLMRTVLGLALPSSGTYRLFDGLNAREAGRQIGSLVETPGFFKNCTAMENLERFSRLYGADTDEVPGILEMVGLGSAGSKKVRQFSLGMQQRLGIGIAVIGHPAFMILDEPVNGLDPAGILEIRNLILELNRKEGTTFLISSHLVDELSKIATRYGIIRNGRLVEEITESELLYRCRGRLRLVVDDPYRASALITGQYPAVGIEIRHHALLLDAGPELAPDLNRLLLAGGVSVSSIGTEDASVESYFVERIG